MKTTDPEPIKNEDVQAVVAAGFNTLPFGRYLLLQVTNPQKARHWLTEVIESGLLASAADITRERERRRGEVVMVAMSFSGLMAAGLKPDAERPFPSTFQQGMSDPTHARALGDRELADWRWGDKAPGAGLQWHVAHWLVAHYWSDEVQHSGCRAPLSDAELQAAGFTVVSVQADSEFLQPDGGAKEPFGFSDGIAQPVIRGLRHGKTGRHREIEDEARPYSSDRAVAAGEFLLGHPNEYNQTAYVPGAAGWQDGKYGFAFNGSYIAVRQIVQDVTAFLDYEAKHPMPAAAHDGTAPPTAGELMVGRRRDGTPLSACPRHDGQSDDFRYRMDDLQGFGCPRGAHVRRANPRDTLGHDIKSGLEASKLHRLLRRGRSYVGGESWVQRCHPEERGMFFMALNADIDRQFAFVQQQWIASSTFGDLSHESDPLLGARYRDFTVQRRGAALCLERLPRFTYVVGGGYFFLPSLPALRYLADLV